MEGAKFSYPKIFTPKKKVSHLFLGQVSFRDFFYYYDPKISVEIVIWLVKVSIYGYRIWPLDVVPMLVHSAVGPLGFNFSHILFFITF